MVSFDYWFMFPIAICVATIAMSTLVGGATFFSPIYAGWIFDQTSSYIIVLLTFLIILLTAASLFFVLYYRSLNIKQLSIV